MKEHQPNGNMGPDNWPNPAKVNISEKQEVGAFKVVRNF